MRRLPVFCRPADANALEGSGRGVGGVRVRCIRDGSWCGGVRTSPDTSALLRRGDGLRGGNCRYFATRDSNFFVGSVLGSTCWGAPESEALGLPYAGGPTRRVGLPRMFRA